MNSHLATHMPSPHQRPPSPQPTSSQAQPERTKTEPDAVVDSGTSISRQQSEATHQGIGFSSAASTSSASRRQDQHVATIATQYQDTSHYIPPFASFSAIETGSGMLFGSGVGSANPEMMVPNAGGELTSPTFGRRGSNAGLGGGFFIPQPSPDRRMSADLSSMFGSSTSPRPSFSFPTSSFYASGGTALPDSPYPHHGSLSTSTGGVPPMLMHHGSWSAAAPPQTQQPQAPPQPPQQVQPQVQTPAPAQSMQVAPYTSERRGSSSSYHSRMRDSSPEDTRNDSANEEEDSNAHAYDDRRHWGTGRKKIRIEFIQNKLKRQITFSKRKSGMLKKIHELTTLTGTEAMLVLVSETGHIYSYATQKLSSLVSDEETNVVKQALARWNVETRHLKDVTPKSIK